MKYNCKWQDSLSWSTWVGHYHGTIKHSRAQHILLPHVLGQVKLPAGQVDLNKVFFYISRSKKCIILEVRQVKNFGYVDDNLTHFQLSVIKIYLKTTYIKFHPNLSGVTKQQYLMSTYKVLKNNDPFPGNTVLHQWLSARLQYLQC